MKKLIFMSLLMCSLIAFDSNAAKRRHVFLNRDNRPYCVESIPEKIPIEEGPPEAIDGTINEIYVDALKESEPILEFIGEYKLTFYCPCYQCSEGWDHQTSSGAYATEGRTVACGNLPAGTNVYIEGYGYRVVEDTGGGVRGNHIDIFKESHYECLQHGIKYAKVYLVKNSI